MNDIKNLDLINFKVFFHKFYPKEQCTFHLAAVVLRYFNMARIQAEHFVKAMWPTLNSDSSVALYSYMVGMYCCLRTCLEASQKLNIYFHKETADGDLEKYRGSHKLDIQKIVDICNDFIKHPINGEASGFCEPGGFDTFYNVLFNEYSATDPQYFQRIKINLVNDIEVVSRYLEGLAQIYVKLLPLNINNATRFN